MQPRFPEFRVQFSLKAFEIAVAGLVAKHVVFPISEKPRI